MSLKKIEITGFKSFADRTVIEFSHLLNAIVGPNGCGKSNIVDAFLWVLGEQSARVLRGSKMHDVIFAGTVSRKPVNMAEVTLTFCNASRFLSVPYEEVAITRRLFRDGESEYLINKQTVRLRDVQELFVHTGIGKEAFAVIGQGKVAELIGQNPQERRALFEEVSGIAHFLSKRRESQKKLDLAEQNLTRVQDVYVEVETQKDSLEKQAYEARKFQQQRKKLSELEQALCFRRFNEQKTLHDKLKKSIDSLEKDLEKAETLEKQEQEQLLKRKASLNEWREEELQRQSQLHQAKGSIAVIQKELGLAKDQQASLKASLARTAKEIFSYQQSIEQYLDGKKKVEAELASAQKELELFQKEKEVAEGQWKKLQQATEAQEGHFKELNSGRFRLHSQVQLLDSDLTKANLTLGVSQEKISDYQKKIEQLQNEEIAYQAESDKKKEELEACIATVEEKKKLLAECQTQLQAIEKEIEKLRKSQEALRSQFLEVSAKHKILEKLENDFEGYSPAAKHILKEAKKRSSPLFERVFSLTDFVNLEELEASDILVRLYDTTLVVKTVDDFTHCSALCEQLKAKELSIICLELLDIKEGEEKKSLYTHFSEAITSTEGWEAVKSLLKKKSKKPLWLRPGLLVDTQGVVHSTAKKEHNLFKQKSQIKELQAEMLLLEEKMNLLQQEQKSLQDSKAKLMAKKQQLDEEMRRSDMKVVSCNFQLQATQKQKNTTKELLEKHKSEWKGLEKSLSSLKESAAVKEKVLVEAKEALRIQEEKLGHFEKEREQSKKEYSKAFEQKQKTAESYELARTELQKQRHNLELTSLKEQQTVKAHQQALEQQERYQNRLQEVQKQEVQLKERLAESEALFGKLSLVSGEKKPIGPSFEKEISALEELLFGLRKTKETSLSTSSSQKAQITHAAAQVAQYEEALTQYSGEVDKELALLAIEELEKQCRSVRGSVERSKGVNLMAIEEYEVVLQRYKLLEDQLSDLQKAKTDLVEVIQGLEKDSRKAFSRTFEEVKQAFQKNFETLFNGGKADLVLVENKDLLQAGVEIMVQPPGKQMRSMQLLSGGEKSLTALALLFACFELKPAPFCILDEVDAALDETNVERFSRLVRSFAEKSQFLLITHNKRTMASSDALIGVSMQEKGISQIITVDFQKRSTQQYVHA